MKKAFALMALLLTFLVNAQLKTVSGNYDFLKEGEEVNVVLKFDDVRITTDNFTEEQFIDSHRKTFLAREAKTQTDWDTWKEGWDHYKSEVFADDFLSGLSKSKKVKFGKNLETKYTLVVDTKWFYPGWSGGFIFQPAKISADLQFVETANPANVMLELKADKLQGAGSGKKEELAMEYNRIGQAYEKMGKILVRLLNAKVKK